MKKHKQIRYQCRRWMGNSIWDNISSKLKFGIFSKLRKLFYVAPTRFIIEDLLFFEMSYE